MYIKQKMLEDIKHLQQRRETMLSNFEGMAKCCTEDIDHYIRQLSLNAYRIHAAKRNMKEMKWRT